MPVLSEQRIVIPASCSIEASRATIAFFSASMREPSAIVAVHTTCIAIGIDATSSTTPNETASHSWPGSRMMRWTTAIVTSTDEKAKSTCVIESTTFWKLPSSCVEPMSAAVLPKNVLMPVLHTTPSTSPETTVEPIMIWLPADMLTGSDSPVRAA